MYIRKLNDNERSVLSHLVELCCEAYWREAEICRIHFDHGELFFTAKIDSNWDLIEREELSLEDYNQIVETLEGIFEPSKTGSANVENRIVTVTLNSEVGRPLMNLYFDFAGKEREPSQRVIELKIQDLIENDKKLSEEERLDSDFIN